MAYAEAAELAAFLRIDDTREDVHLSGLLDSSTLAIDAFCDWGFDDAAGSASARVFAAADPGMIYVDPISSATDLVIKTGSVAGTFETTWASTDYQLEPLNQRQSGLSNHPYYLIRAIGSYSWPCSREARVQVTARWGWSTVPASVRDACLMHAARLHERRNMPAGIVAGDGFIGRSSLAIDPDVKQLLMPFARRPAVY